MIRSLLNSINMENIQNNEVNKHYIDVNTQADQKFTTFLEDNLSSIITCPISGSVFFSNAIASDGFYYEESVLKEFLSRSSNPKSPLTREPITKKYHSAKLIQQMVTFADKYNLEVSKNKFINGDSFEENFEIIQNYIMNGQYENVYKFKNFILSFGDANNKLFCKNILDCEIINDNEYIKCMKYVLDNCTDLTFITNATNNILHIFFRYCKVIELIEYLFTIIPNDTIQNMLSLKNIDNCCPIEFSLNNILPVINYIFDKYIDINVSIEMINSCIMKKLDNNIIMKLINQIDNINEFHSNMSPMFCAISTSNIDIINYLITKNYNMKIKSGEHMDTFHYAAKCRNSTVVEHILGMCDNYEDSESINGFKIIHIACYYNNFNVIMYLLEKFINLTEPITRFKNEEKSYLPINLIELNERLNDEEKRIIIDYIIQLMTLQM